MRLNDTTFWIPKERLALFVIALTTSVLNQVISSGANFILGLYLVRILTPSEFGLYGIGFAIVIFYSGMGNALFLTQMVVHVPDKAPTDRLPYAARILVALILFCLLTAFLTSVFLVVGDHLWQPFRVYNNLFMAIISASIAYLLKDFFIRHAYTARKESWALGVNVATASALFVFLFTLHTTTIAINAAITLWVYAVSNFVGVIVGLFLVKPPLVSVRFKEVVDDWKEAWQGGIWAFGGGIVIWSQSQAYLYVTAFFLGPAAVGMANAAKLLIAPAAFLLTAANQILMPRMATLRVSNIQRMYKMNNFMAVFFILFAISYTLILFLVSDSFFTFIIGNNYEDIKPLVLTWCLVLVFQFSRASTTVVLQVMKAFRRIMLDNLLSALVAIVIAVVLLQMMGVQGAIIGTAFGELILSIFLYRSVRLYKLQSYLNE